MMIKGNFKSVRFFSSAHSSSPDKKIKRQTPYIGSPVKALPFYLTWCKRWGLSINKEGILGVSREIRSFYGLIQALFSPGNAVSTTTSSLLLLSLGNLCLRKDDCLFLCGTKYTDLRFHLSLVTISVT